MATYLCIPPVASAVLAGFAAGILQSSLGLSDASAAFTPRMAAAIGALIIFGAWMASFSTCFCAELWSSIPELVR